MTFLRRWWPVGAALLAPLGVLLYLRADAELDVQWFSAVAHVVVMVIVAALALAVAGIAVHAASRSGQPGVVWLAVGCGQVGLLLLGHGLTTPGALGNEDNLWVGRLPYGAMAMISVCLFAAGRSPKRPVNQWVASHVQAVLVAALLPTVLLKDVEGAEPLYLNDPWPYPVRPFAWR